MPRVDHKRSAHDDVFVGAHAPLCKKSWNKSGHGKVGGLGRNMNIAQCVGKCCIATTESCHCVDYYCGVKYWG